MYLPLGEDKQSPVLEAEADSVHLEPLVDDEVLALDSAVVNSASLNGKL